MLNQVRPYSSNKHTGYTSLPSVLKRNKPVTTFQSLKGKCYRCGDESHNTNTCKFINTCCNKCNKLGHIAKVCLSKQFKVQPKPTPDINQAALIDSHENMYEINTITHKNCDTFTLNVVSDSKLITMEYRSSIKFCIVQ